MDWQSITARLYPVPARPTGLWTLVVDFVEGPCMLKISVPGNDAWSYAPTSQFGPDGDLSSLLKRSNCLFPDGPVGALIGKIGGSSAGITDGVLFLVGKMCIVTVAAPGGPLYLTINDEYTGMWNNAGTVQVLAWSKTLPADVIDAGTASSAVGVGPPVS